MSRAELWKTLRQISLPSLLFAALLLPTPPPAVAQTCEDNCNTDYSACTGWCDQSYNDCWYQTPGYYCDSDRNSCNSSCDSSYNSCTSSCAPPPPYTGDGHALCDGWDRQGDCAYAHLGVSSTAGGAEFRRLRGGGGYAWQTFLTWNSAEFGGFGRFTVADGTAGIISTSPLPGQVPLYRWSTRKGFVYSTYSGVTGSDYVYGGIAGYVWPAGSGQGYPLYQFYSQEYGHFYTNYPSEIRCQPPVNWAVQGEMARVNWPAPITQAFRNCSTQVLGPIPPSCDPFFAERCRISGGFFNFNNCTCF
ncbi:MAG: hypothetical protein ACJ75H_17945 [Thermoanaerobaculia bacterium]